MYIRQLKPTLNAHEKSIPLQLFNRCSLVSFYFNLFSLYEIYTNNNNKTQCKNKYLEQNKHIVRYIIRPYKVQEARKLEEDR